MKNPLQNVSVILALLSFGPQGWGQNIAYPPKVIVNGNLLTGSGGSYSTATYYDNGTPVSASLSVSSGVVIFGASTGYWTPPYITTYGYWTSGYEIPGYTIPGYYSAPYNDAENNWVQDWIPEVWVPPVWVEGEWVDDVWTPAVWSPVGIDATGTYQQFAFELDNDVTALPADQNGNPWSVTPQFGIPAFQVNTALWSFKASDTVAAYDYFSGPAADSYLWVTGTFYGGYDPQVGAFSGTNSNGYLRDTSGSSVRVLPRNGDGSFLAIGTPQNGPQMIWSNGLSFKFLTHDGTNGVDVYFEETTGFAYVHAPSEGVSPVSGLVIGSCVNSAFQATPAGTFGAYSNGLPMPAGRQPQWGPPAVYVMNAVWSYRGSTSSADYYGGVRPGQCLSIGANGAVFYSDRSLNFVETPGLYSGGVFQNLPVAMRGVAADGSAWTSRPTTGDNSTYPEAVTVEGRPWYYSSAQSTPGRAVYVGPQSGQTLTIEGSIVNLIDPARSTNLTGAYADGKFTFAGSAIKVRKANADGTPFDPFGSIATTLEGEIDITGNSLSLGAWANDNLTSGFSLLFKDGDENDQFPASEISFLATRQRTHWLWSHSTADLNTPLTMMHLDADHRLSIFAPAPSPRGPIVLDPAGISRFDGPVRIAPQGDIPMFEAQ